MNNIKRAVTIALTLIAILLPGGCSVVGTDPDVAPFPSDGTVLIKKSVKLNNMSWISILLEVSTQSSLVTLDLSGCDIDDNPNVKDLKIKSSSLNLNDVQTHNSVLFELTQEFPTFNTGGSEAPFPVEWVVFDPQRDIPFGKDKIARLILPDKATVIPWGEGKAERQGPAGTVENGFFKITINTPTFAGFTALKSVTGRNVKQIGRYAFAQLKALERVEFPNVTHNLGKYELSTSAAIIVREDIPSYGIDGYPVRDIDYAAFYECTALKDVQIPKARVISIAAFQGCTSLRSIDFPLIWLLHQHVFEGCTGLTQINFPFLTKVGNYAFKDCTNLTRVLLSGAQIPPPNILLPDLPRGTCGRVGDGMGGPGDGLSLPGDPADKFWDVAYEYSTVLFDGAFSGCRSLKEVYIQSAWNVKFGSHSFANVGKTLNLYLSDRKHSLNDHLTFGFDLPYYNFSSITLETINFYGPSEENFNIIQGGKNPDGSDAGYGGGLNTLIPRIDPSKPRITLVRK